ncbi:MAG: UDP-3-O-[3-hydroxymyristoyl] N-acetylglucosamine deacetylase [Bacteroidales bacterium]|nr:UDP-3-O-[3-hydroxymyristoyl] N-acetylglucosamine deacetylase [Bacteroidales bacterium]
MKQQTIRKKITFEGTGLHTGRQVKMVVEPAPEGAGICFKRTDIPGQPVLPALASYVVNTDRSTVLGHGHEHEHEHVQVSTVEHLMAAFYGMGIDNVCISLNGPEVPVLDGSALPFAQAIHHVGIVEQQEEIDYFRPKTPIIYEEKNSGTFIKVEPAEDFSLSLCIDFSSDVVGRQEYTCSAETDFIKELAPARTFVFLDQILPLFKKGLVQGGHLDNALVIAEKKVSEEDMEWLRTMYKQPGIIPDVGYINKEGLRFPNECARHKAVDLIGDLMLAGKRICASVCAYKPGHKANVAVARMIKNQCLPNRNETKT